jgi:hypothetical protein
MSERKNRDEPLGSDELIRRAKESLAGRPDDDAIDQIVSDLENIEVDVPIEEEFPEPVPRFERGRSEPRRPRRVTSTYDTLDTDDDPFERDAGPSRRAIVGALLALLLLAAGAALVFLAAANGL